MGMARGGLCGNSIKMQGHFVQEGNDNTVWDTAGDPMKTRAKFPKLEMMLYDMVEYLFKANRTHNELRLWIDRQEKDDSNF